MAATLESGTAASVVLKDSVSPLVKPSTTSPTSESPSNSPRATRSAPAESPRIDYVGINMGEGGTYPLIRL
jgi:hypothetical protein